MISNYNTKNRQLRHFHCNGATKTDKHLSSNFQIVVNLFQVPTFKLLLALFLAIAFKCMCWIRLSGEKGFATT